MHMSKPISKLSLKLGSLFSWVELEHENAFTGIALSMPKVANKEKSMTF